MGNDLVKDVIFLCPFRKVTLRWYPDTSSRTRRKEAGIKSRYRLIFHPLVPPTTPPILPHFLSYH